MNTFKPIVFLFALIHVTGSDVTTTKAPANSGHQRVYNLGELTRHVDTLTQQLRELRADVARKGTFIDSLSHRLQDKEKEIASMESRVNILESSVSFHVRFVNDSVGNLIMTRGHSQVLLFNAVRFQHGGKNYDKSTGQFTAPVNGTYAFFLTITRNHPHKDMCVEAYIFKNDYILAVVSACAPGYTTASNSAIVYMRKGDVARVQTRHPNMIFGHTHTTFSGMKI